MLNKNRSSINKSVFLSGLIITVSIIHFLFDNHFENQYRNSYNSLKIIERNNHIINEILLRSNNYILSNNKSTKDYIAEMFTEYDYSISVLLTGGNIKLYNELSQIQKPTDQQIIDLLGIESSWNDFKIQINTILKSDKAIQESALKKADKISKNIILKQKIYADELIQKNDNFKSISFIIHIVSILLYIILLTLVYLLIKNKFSKSIQQIINSIKQFTKVNKIEIDRLQINPETNEFYKELQNLNYKFKDISLFVNNLLEDNYEIEIERFNRNNEIEQALIKLRNKLKENIEQNKIKLSEEQERLRFSEIQAKFNDILRDSASNLKTLAEASLINLVKIFNASLGGFFIFKDESNPPYLELTSAFAYDRIKSLSKTIYLDDGLVGMCALEKNTILLDKIPPGYMEIESGLGEASPENLLIIPLKSDENLLGVIEIASFNKFTKNEITFIENIAEDIASTLETTKISDRTYILLEESKKKSDELALRDSEMSEKIEELREIQIETKRSEIEMSSLISSVDKILYKVELTNSGKISDANKLFIGNIQYNINDLKNKSFFDLIEYRDNNQTEEILNKIKLNESIQIDLTLITKQNNKIYVRSLFSPVKNESNQIVRILFLAENISYMEEISKKNKVLLEEIENKNKTIQEKEAELSKNIINNQKNVSLNQPEIQNVKEQETKIKHVFESETEQKYLEWLNQIKSKLIN